MLALTRRNKEVILIGDDIQIEVVQGGPVKLGITAPKHVKILRKEVHEAIQQQARQKSVVPHPVNPSPA